MGKLSKNSHNKRLMRSLFLVPTKEQVETSRKLAAELECEEKKHRAAAQENEVFAEGIDRLVKRGESPTRNFHAEQKRRNSIIDGQLNKLIATKRAKHFAKLHTCPEPLSLKARKKSTLSEFLAHTPIASTVSNGQPIHFKHKTVKVDGEDVRLPKVNYKTGELYQVAEPKPDCVVRLYGRDWSQKYKIGFEVRGLGAKVAPPVITGDRVTSELTKNATRAIMESGAYLGACRNGYNTFTTMTFDDQARKDLKTIIAISGNKTKRYTHKYRTINPHTGRPKNFTERYVITCYGGVPHSLNVDQDETITCYANAIPATGAFTPVTFEPKTTIGKEVSRFMDAVQKMYQRGWAPDFVENEIREYPWGKVACYDTSESREYPWGKVTCHGSISKMSPKTMFCPELVRATSDKGDIITESGFNAKGEPMFLLDDKQKYNPRKHTELELLPDESREYPWGKVFSVYPTIEKGAPLDYMWVAEQPKNDKGEDNPHVHLMMRWRVEKKYFRAWAARLESLWGKGFAKLEKINNPNAAANYILKAVGYLTKSGEASDQGEILGNRYSISASARAPKWECIGEFYADNFLAILGELREKLNRRKAKLHSEKTGIKNHQAKAAAFYKKMNNIEQKAIGNNKPSQKRQELIDSVKADLKQLDTQLKKCNQELFTMPFVNDFAIGAMDETQAAAFLHWAMSKRFWNAEVKEGCYSNWQELKQNTADALKEVRSYWRHHEHTLVAKHMQNAWAVNDLRYESVSEHQNIELDEFGNEWELVA